MFIFIGISCFLRQLLIDTGVLVTEYVEDIPHCGKMEALWG
jgi:hypothetical protein